MTLLKVDAFGPKYIAGLKTYIQFVIQSYVGECNWFGKFHEFPVTFCNRCIPSGMM